MARLPGSGVYKGRNNMVVATAAYTANEDDFVQCDTTTAGFTVTLPAISTVTPGAGVDVFKVDAAAHTVTVAPPAADVTAGVRINGATSDTLVSTQYLSHRYVAVGVTYAFGTEAAASQWYKVY